MPTLFTLFTCGSIALGAASATLGLRAGTKARRLAGILIGSLLASPGLALLYAAHRPNRTRVDHALAFESWTVVDGASKSDGAHNAFTDLAFWRGSFWLAYISSPSHLASDRSRLVLWRSDDAHHWQEAARFDGGGEDIRDPKLAIVHDRLSLYALLNVKRDPQPHRSISTWSADGVVWAPMADAAPEGWLLGRPKTWDGAAWYAPAHRLDRYQSALLRSEDGLSWVFHSLIHEGDGADETAVEFLPDGRLLAAVRLEMTGGLFGHPQGGTLLRVAALPFTTWQTLARSAITRLDGPNLFRCGDRVYAAGRYQPHVAGPFHWQGAVLSRKRTALFLASAAPGGGLIHLSDLPSSGDTAYPGTALHEDRLFVSYYTSDPRRDPPWLAGMFQPTSIRLAEVHLARLEAVTKENSRNLL